MASTIKVNNIQNQCGANIVNKCSTTITLGASGDTIQLACGASQTGFGRTGTVDWDTTAKTAGFTAVSGVGYFVNTTSGAITVTLPATPSAGDIVGIADYANTWDTNNVTVGRNGSNIEGAANDFTANIEGASITFVYVDATKGWITINSGNSSQAFQNLFVEATGGCISTCGDYKIHTFTSPGTFQVTNTGPGSSTVDYLVVAGGGSGAIGGNYNGAGGAGGYRESSGAASGCYTTSPLGACVSALPVSVTGYPVTVGGGGAPNSSGSNSIFSTITSSGGGKGGGSTPSVTAASSGGSGGGMGQWPSPAGGAGNGNTPPVSPPQGNPGAASQVGAGGGGGATASGNAGPASANGGPGGAGAGTAINPSCTVGTPGPNGALRYFAGGGGGAAWNGCAGIGGIGGGGQGSAPTPGGGCNTAGATNTGGGGGGGNSDGGTNPAAGGGSGIVIIRYKYQ